MSLTDEDFEDLPLDTENEQNEKKKANQNEADEENVGGEEQFEEKDESEIGQPEEIREAEEQGEPEEIGDGEGEGEPEEIGEEGQGQPEEIQEDGKEAEEVIKSAVKGEDEESAVSQEEGSVRETKEDQGEAMKVEKMEETEDDATQAEEEMEEEEEEDYLSNYNPDDFLSEPHISKNGTLPIDILEFEYPFSAHNAQIKCEKYVAFRECTGTTFDSLYAHYIQCGMIKIKKEHVKKSFFDSISHSYAFVGIRK